MQVFPVLTRDRKKRKKGWKVGIRTARPGRTFHSSRNTPCGISLGRWSPRYLLFCSIILARRCVSRRHGRNRTPDRKRSHVRDKSRACDFTTVRPKRRLQKRMRRYFPLPPLPLHSSRPRSIPRDTRECELYVRPCVTHM